MLVVMAGLPGAGKSTVAEVLAKALGATVLSVDPVEAAMWRAGVDRSQPTGLAAYVVVEAIASEQLRLGATVVVDAVNAVQEARQQWVELAARRGCPVRFVEVVCSDGETHRRRLRARRRDLGAFPEPSWPDIVSRAQEQATWSHQRLVLDSVLPVEHNAALALAYVRGSVAGRVTGSAAPWRR